MNCKSPTKDQSNLFDYKSLKEEYEDAIEAESKGRNGLNKSNAGHRKINFFEAAFKHLPSEDFAQIFKDFDSELLSKKFRKEADQFKDKIKNELKKKLTDLLVFFLFSSKMRKNSSEKEKESFISLTSPMNGKAEGLIPSNKFTELKRKKVEEFGILQKRDLITQKNEKSKSVPKEGVKIEKNEDKARGRDLTREKRNLKATKETNLPRESTIDLSAKCTKEKEEKRQDKSLTKQVDAPAHLIELIKRVEKETQKIKENPEQKSTQNSNNNKIDNSAKKIKKPQVTNNNIADKLPNPILMNLNSAYQRPQPNNQTNSIPKKSDKTPPQAPQIANPNLSYYQGFAGPVLPASMYQQGYPPNFSYYPPYYPYNNMLHPLLNMMNMNMHLGAANFAKPNVNPSLNPNDSFYYSQKESHTHVPDSKNKNTTEQEEKILGRKTKRPEDRERDNSESEKAVTPTIESPPLLKLETPKQITETIKHNVSLITDCDHIKIQEEENNSPRLNPVIQEESQIPRTQTEDEKIKTIIEIFSQTFTTDSLFKLGQIISLDEEKSKFIHSFLIEKRYPKNKQEYLFLFKKEKENSGLFLKVDSKKKKYSLIKKKI